MRVWNNPFVALKFKAFWRYIEGKSTMTLMGVYDTIESFKLCHQCQENITVITEQIVKSLKERLGAKAFAELRSAGFISDLLFHEIDGMLGVKCAYDEIIKREYSKEYDVCS